MHKLICYSCSHKIELENPEPLSLINCPECKAAVTIPGMVGDYILEEILSCNNLYKTYRGHLQGSDNNLTIKVINSPEVFTDQKLISLKSTLLEVPEEYRLTISKVNDQVIATRHFYETSLQRYLEGSRPQADKALYLLKETALILEEWAKKGTHPANCMIGNLMMNEKGKVIFTDLLFREALQKALRTENKETILTPHTISTSFMEKGESTVKDTIFSYGCLAYLLCCGSYPWPFGSYSLVQKARKIKPEVILDLRGDFPEGLKSFISDLIEEKNPVFNSFSEIVEKLNKLTGEETVSKKKKSKKSSGKEKKKAVIPSVQPKIRKTKRKKSSPVLPVAIILMVCLTAITFLKLANSGETKKNVARLPEKDYSAANNSKNRKEDLKSKKEIIKVAVPKTIEVTLEESVEFTQPKEETEVKIDRGAIKAELLPPDLNFDSLIAVMDKYIAATSSGEKELEEKKIEIVSTYRDHLLVRLYKRPYQGIIYLNGQNPFRGKVTKADESTIQLVNLKTEKNITCSWKDFEFSQFNEFAGYYAASYADDFSLSETNNVMFEKMSEEYCRLAVFMDWYGFRQKAIDFKKKALSLSSETAKELDLLIKEETMN